MVNDNSYVVSEQTWQDLPEDLQTVLEDGIEETADFHTKQFRDEEDELLDFFRDEGLEITEPDLEEFRDAVSEAYPKYYDKIGEGAEKYKEVIDEARE